MIELSFTALKVIRAFVADPDRSWHGYGFKKTDNISRQAAYKILRRLSDNGWLAPAGIRESTCNRPPQRGYKITDIGLREGISALTELQLSSTIYSSSLRSAR